MFKKSIARIDNESSQSELSNPALHDIIATNHVTYPKKSHEERLSRACKAMLIMIILVLVSIGIIIVTLVLAHSRNTLMAIVTRSAEENSYSTSNHSRSMFISHQQNSTMVTEQTEIENWSQTTTVVTLTSDNLPTLTSSNVHISSSNRMTTNQQYESMSSTMKPYPSLNTIGNKLSTIQTTVSTTYLATSSKSDVTESTIISQDDDIETSTEKLFITSTESISSSDREQTTAMFEQSSFSSFIREHFNIQPSTVMMPKVEKQKQEQSVHVKKLIEQDIVDDILF